MARKLKHFRRLTLFYVVAVLVALLRRVPKSAAIRLGAMGGLIAHAFASLSRRRAMKHLAAAFGDSMSAERRRAVCRRMFANLGMNGLEMLTIPKWTREEIEDAVDPGDGHAKVEEARKAGRGVILLTGHFGNWELFGSYAAMHYDLYVVAREVRFRKYEELMSRIRQEAGLKVIYQSDSPREILRVLRRNAAIAILPDQDIRRLNGVFVNFFGIPAYTPTGPAALSLASGAPILPVYLVRQGAKHRAVTGDIIWPARSGDKERDIIECTGRWTRVFEQVVREHPDHWIWMHKRWDTTPEKLARKRRKD